jgi:large subunit ribosomal protein L28
MARRGDRRYWLPTERRWVRLRLSTTGIRTVDRDGIESVVARMRATGRKV